MKMKTKIIMLGIYTLIIIGIGLVIYNAIENEETCKPFEPIMNEGFYDGYFNNQCNYVRHPKIRGKLKDNKDLVDRIYIFSKNNCSKELHDKDFIKLTILLAKERKVNPALWWSIAFADTGCGKHMKGRQNYTNIGSLDRGGTFHYNTKIHNVWDTFNTLQNKYLGGYQKLGLLSNGGRQYFYEKHHSKKDKIDWLNNNKKIYASSPHNWNRNVLNAMRFIIGDLDINEDYEFRLK